MSLATGNQVCKKCGNHFSLAERICPFCGADQLASSRRRLANRQAGGVWGYLQRNRRVLIYVSAGLSAGVLGTVVFTYLSSLLWPVQNGPAPEYSPTIFEVVSRQFGEFLVTYRWPVTLGVIGGAVGLLLAVREQQNRKAKARVERMERRKRRRERETSQ